MSEVTFAKSFLGALASRPQKLSADFSEDARSYPARTPYILPHMPKPMSKLSTLAPGADRSVSVTLKSLRNPPLDVKLAALPLTTSLLEVKTALSEQAGIPTAKLKLLHKKKPVADSKALKDLVGEGETVVDFAVMVMGGAAAVVVAQTQEEPKQAGGGETAQGPSGREVVESPAFWDDLRGFLLQRVRDEKQADELFSLFLRAWEEAS